MAETIEPIAPPTSLTKRPAVPTTEVAPAIVTPAAGTKAGLSSAYRQVAETGDPSKMLEFAKSARGTEFEEPAMNAWRGMANRTAIFDDITNAVDKKGGPQSPQGKLELVNQWPKSQNEPSILRGLAEHLMGNPNARFFVSEGMIKPKIIMDRNGMPLQQNWTESGRLVNVIDPVSGKEISPDEYGKRSGGIESVTETLPYIANKEQLKMNQEAAQKANAATNDLSAASQQLGVYHNTASKLMDDLFKSLKDQDLLSPDERQQLASFATRGVQSGASSSQAAAALDQYVRGGTASLNQEQRKTLDASLRKFGMSIGPTGSIVDSEGKTVSENKLNNLQTSGSFGREFNQSFQQSRDEAMNSLILKKLNPQQQQMFGQILDLNKQIEQKRIELAEKHGANASLPFLMNPILPNVGDQYARYQVQQMVGLRNAELAQKYADYRKDVLSKYPAGTAPDPGEIEKAFTRTNQYLDFQKDTQDYVRNLMNTINKTKPTGTKIATEPIAGEVPGAEINRTRPAVPPVNTKSPTENPQGAVAPPVPSKTKTPEGFKVERSNREFKVKE
jgi:hypothetical protein